MKRFGVLLPLLVCLSGLKARGQETLFRGLAGTYSGNPAQWFSGQATWPTARLSYRAMPANAAEVSFNSVPAQVSLSYISISAASQNTTGLGDLVNSAPAGGFVDHVETVLVNWARAANWPAWQAVDPKGYSHPVTISFYQPSRAANGSISFLPLGTSTSWVHVPWRPEFTESGAPYPYNGIAFKAVIPFSTPVSLPAEYAFLISFNTEKTGFQPVGTAGPYNLLNFALSDAAPSVGTDPNRDSVLWVKPPQWYYPASNWAGLGSPMVRVAMRQTAEPQGWTNEAPVASGSYHIVARDGDNVVGEAYASVARARAAVELSGLTRSKGGAYSGPLVTTTPPGLGVSLTYNGSSDIPNEVGTYQVNAVVQDPNYFGSTADLLTVTGPSYEDWICLHLNDPEDPDLSAEDGDADGDGLSNLLEYALGLDPAAPTANPLSIALSSTGPVLLSRQKALPGISMVVEHSEDLLQWHDLPVRVLEGEGDMEMIEIGTDWRQGMKGYIRLRVGAPDVPADTGDGG